MKQLQLLLRLRLFAFSISARKVSILTHRMQLDNSVFSGLERRAAELMNVLRRKKKSRDMVELSPVNASVAGTPAPFVCLL
jgi:hypothetical protein